MPDSLTIANLPRHLRRLWPRVVGPALILLAAVACSDGSQAIRTQVADPVAAAPPVAAQPAGNAAGNAMDRAAAPVAVAGAEEEDGPRRRALWVLCEGAIRALEDPAAVEGLISHAQALSATDLFVQVYRGGRAWYDASLADAAPYRAIVEAHGVDTLALLLSRAHDEGLRVHAWVNVLSLSHNTKAPILLELGREAVHVDRRGRSLLDYPDMEIPAPDAPWYRMGTRGLYLDPGVPAVADRLVATFSELIERYPQLDGLHLDYIRHPGVLPLVPGSRFGVGLDFGYGERSRLQFQRDTGRRPPRPGPSPHIENSASWDVWRREKVTELVARIAESTRALQPQLALSAAVISYSDRAYLTLYQDWRRWLEEGLLDFAVPMIYTVDDRLLRYQIEAFAGTPHAERIWAGVGSWLFAEDPTRALAQLAIAGDPRLGGEAVFSYDSVVATPGLLAALSAGAVAETPEAQITTAETPSLPKSVSAGSPQSASAPVEP